METYREENNTRVLEKINDLTVDLPMFVRRFANEYLVTRNKAPRTVLGYVGDIKVFFEFLEKTQGIPVMQISIKTLGSLTADDIQDYLMYLMRYDRKDPNNSRTIKESNNAPARARKLSSLRALYRYLIAHNHLEKNVAELVDMPKIALKKRKSGMYSRGLKQVIPLPARSICFQRDSRLAISRFSLSFSIPGSV